MSEDKNRHENKMLNMNYCNAVIIEDITFHHDQLKLALEAMDGHKIELDDQGKIVSVDGRKIVFVPGN